MEIQKYAPGRTMVTGTDQTNTNSNKRNSCHELILHYCSLANQELWTIEANPLNPQELYGEHSILS